MSKKILMLLFVFALALVAAPQASAQTTEPTEVMFHWGPIHKGPGQAVVLNLELSDHPGSALSVPVEFRLEDKGGNVIYSYDITLSSGRAVSIVFAIGPEIRMARSTIQADIYAAIAPDIRLIQPCIKVLLPPGPTSPVDSMTATMEVMDVFTGRVQVFGNNPNIRAGVGVPQ
jgi:hypothetical protein